MDSLRVTFVGPHVGIKELNQQVNIKVFPNPANDQITIASDALILKVEILDLTGETQLYKTGMSSKQYALNVSDLSEGIYIVKLSTSQGQTTQKLLKL